MAVLVQLHDIRLSFPDKTVLAGVSITVHRGDRIALLGDNGAGKTSLFQIMQARLVPDAGRVMIADGARLGYLDQAPFGASTEAGGSTCMEIALEPFSDLRELERRIEQVSETLARAQRVETSRHLLKVLGDAQQRFEERGGYEYRSRAAAMLAGLGLPARYWNEPVERLSAGQKVRLALVRLLLEDHDLLLLDEPTNHLDLEARIWLEGYLQKLKTAYAIATHDRRFVDAVATSVAHLDHGALTFYPGNYSAFRLQSAQRLETAWRAYEKRQKVVRRLQAQARTYRDWATAKERQKRGAADKGYISHRAAKLMKRSIMARRRMETTIERMKVEKPRGPDPIAIAFRSPEAHQLLRTRDLAVGYDAASPIVSGITINLSAGDRLALQGPNGSGKTTVLRTFVGEIQPLAGEIRLVPAARPGYFDQETRQIDFAQTVLDAVLAIRKAEALVRTVMGRMRIRRESVLKPVGALSAGERSKVLLTRLILGDHNLLILDEPTNYLDIDTQDALLDALVSFPGGIVFVSHDRHFIDTLATASLTVGGA